MDTKQLQLVTQRQAQRLKAAGFDWDCGYHYRGENRLKDYPPLSNKELAENSFSAPTVALALEWVRENWLLADWLDFSGEYDEDGEPLFYRNYLFGKELRKTSKKAMPRKSIESALLDELLNVLEKEEKQ
jgi:hypothetical protein